MDLKTRNQFHIKIGGDGDLALNVEHNRARLADHAKALASRFDEAVDQTAGALNLSSAAKTELQRYAQELLQEQLESAVQNVRVTDSGTL